MRELRKAIKLAVKMAEIADEEMWAPKLYCDAWNRTIPDIYKIVTVFVIPALHGPAVRCGMLVNEQVRNQAVSAFSIADNLEVKWR